MRTRRSGIVIAGTIVLASVFAAAAPATADSGVMLAATGLAPETFLWAGIGAAVLVLGGLLLFASRLRARRAAQEPESPEPQSQADAGPADPPA